ELAVIIDAAVLQLGVQRALEAIAEVKVDAVRQSPLHTGAGLESESRAAVVDDLEATNLQVLVDKRNTNTTADIGLEGAEVVEVVPEVGQDEGGAQVTTSTKAARAFIDDEQLVKTGVIRVSGVAAANLVVASLEVRNLDFTTETVAHFVTDGTTD